MFNKRLNEYGGLRTMIPVTFRIHWYSIGLPCTACSARSYFLQQSIVQSPSLLVLVADVYISVSINQFIC